MPSPPAPDRPSDDLATDPPSDTAFFGLVHDDPAHARFRVVEHLSRMDHRLYGGTAIGVSVTTAEHLTGRSALWMTTQFVATAASESEVHVHTEILAPGKRTNQVRVTATTDQGHVVFASLGATGPLDQGGIEGSYDRAPVVGTPDDAEPWSSPFSGMAEAAGIDPSVLAIPPRTGFTEAIELRKAAIIEHPDPGPGRTCVWARRRDGVPITPAVASFVADMVPMSVARAVGRITTGTSLDNTVRVGAFRPSEWILLDLRPHFAAGGYGHGLVHVWDESGALMATASQTASMKPFDPDNAPWLTPNP